MDTSMHKDIFKLLYMEKDSNLQDNLLTTYHSGLERCKRRPTCAVPLDSIIITLPME